ncbi:arginine decarboxylase [Chlorella sorokiniana]|uniref:Arginine decarboxylase n=1 Tax=Chlorella sorokiniana TaxID=3076 RepID=A0A2P6TY93_CHLSO|nr:arginine decarboxylase [Chlorella sorokiniana]|eukprot:PRW59023.1 arginine decarboxylase [Chlorella sorokiniana]
MAWAWRAAPPPATGAATPHSRRAGLRLHAADPVSSVTANSSSDPEAGSSSSSSERQRTPLLQAVEQRGNRLHEVPFHVPGHKRGGSTPPGLQRLLGSALRYDLTELDGLDVLSAASGPIQAAQQAAAEAWGAQASWFLVNGTTGGIHVAVMATCGPGQALILPRNAHLSAFNACVLAGCTPVYAQPCCDPQLGVAHHVTPTALQAAFETAAGRGLRVGAALVVSPTYFGVVADVAGLAAVCHSHGVPLLVDEAHGAHLGLHPSLPPSALQSGADVAIQSTHKQLSAMTQAAMLHLAHGGRVQRQRLARALQVLQSSSPSYLLMVSLDAARAQAADPQAHEESLAAAEYARRELSKLPGLQLLSVEQAAACEGLSSSSGSSSSGGGGGGGSSSSSTSLDPLRLTISLQQLGLAGYEAAAALEEQHGIVPELATPTCVVLALSIGSTRQHAQALVNALQQLWGQRSGMSCSTAGSLVNTMPSVAPAGEARLSPRDAFFAATQAVPAAAAVGRVSAELLCPYPPGVPVTYPGEVITQQALQQLRLVLQQGGTVTGCSDASLQTLQVVAE